MKSRGFSLAMGLLISGTAAHAQSLPRFGPDEAWGDRTYGVGYSGESQWLADVNGDNLTDYIYNRDNTRDLMVMVSTGSGFALNQSWGSRSYAVGRDGKSEWFADVNGDGRADYVYNPDGTRDLDVLLSAPVVGFLSEQNWGNHRFAVGYSGSSQWLKDVNGDGRADYIYNHNGTRDLRVMLSTITGFGQDQVWGTRAYGVGHDGRAEWITDVDGDGQKDYVYNRDGTRDLQVLLSTGNSFAPDQRWGARAYPVGYGGTSQWFADVNGDGRSDYLYNREGTREIRVMLGTTQGFSSDQLWGSRAHGVGYDGKAEWIKDVNGDGLADHVYNRDGTRELWVMLSMPGGYFAADQKWGERFFGVGYDGDGEWLADLNGDGAADYVYNHDGTHQLRAMLAGM